MLHDHFFVYAIEQMSKVIMIPSLIFLLNTTFALNWQFRDWACSTKGKKKYPSEYVLDDAMS